MNVRIEPEVARRTLHDEPDDAVLRGERASVESKHRIGDLPDDRAGDTDDTSGARTSTASTAGIGRECPSGGGAEGQERITGTARTASCRPARSAAGRTPSAPRASAATCRRLCPTRSRTSASSERDARPRRHLFSAALPAAAPSTAGSTVHPRRTSASSAPPTGDSDNGVEAAARFRRPRERAAPRAARAGCEDGAYSPTRARPRTARCDALRDPRRGGILAAGPTRTAG
jgi:hypothetical protein